MRNGLVFRRQMWALATEEIGGGALPTPVAQTGAGGPKGPDGGSGARQMLADAGFPRAAGAPTTLPTPRAAQGMLCRLRSPEAIGRHQSRLEDFIAMLPTPRACSAMASRLNTAGNLEGDRFLNLETVMAREMLPTTSAGLFNDGEKPDMWLDRRERVKEKLGNCNGMGMPLSIAVQLLNPCASDWKGRANWEAAEGHGPQQLPDCLPTGAATYLNPSFVEEMMGFPVNWTNVE